ncbi:hypothetical protein VPH35_085072 [Triticum aestivum]
MVARCGRFAVDPRGMACRHSQPAAQQHHNLCNKVSFRPSFLPRQSNAAQIQTPRTSRAREGREREREISIPDGVPELHLRRDPARRHPAAARRLPPLRLLQHGVLDLSAAHHPGLHPRHHLRHLRARRAWLGLGGERQGLRRPCLMSCSNSCRANQHRVCVCVCVCVACVCVSICTVWRAFL